MLSHIAKSEAIAWDGCHKVYLLMDELQVHQFNEIGAYLITPTRDLRPNQWDEFIIDLWDKSCGLRFMDMISTDQYDRDQFVTLVPQSDDLDGAEDIRDYIFLDGCLCCESGDDYL